MEAVGDRGSPAARRRAALPGASVVRVHTRAAVPVGTPHPYSWVSECFISKAKALNKCFVNFSQMRSFVRKVAENRSCKIAGATEGCI